MQSTGQGGRHSSQPVHHAESTVCSRFGAPAIASTGQASRHSAQPMQRDSSMRASRNGPSLPCAGSSATSGRPVIAASIAMPVAPPGAQRLIAAPMATASA